MADQPEIPVGEHDVPERHDEPHEHRTLYIVIGAVAVVLLVVALFAYTEAKDNDEAQAKAQRLQQAFVALNLPIAPEEDVIVRSLGTDGGAVCKTAGDELGHALLDQQLVAGAGGVGARPIRADSDLLNGELAIIEIYCPQHADAFRDYFQDYNLDDVIRD
jgi:hypothetical protein